MPVRTAYIVGSGERGTTKPVLPRRWRPIVFAVGVLLVASCGGASKPPPAKVSVSGTVQLPAGSSLAPGMLSITSAGGTFPLDPDGSFTLTEPAGGGPATVFVTDAQGNLVLLGHVDSDNPSFDEVDAQSTAEELLFLSTLSFLHPMSEWPQIYSILGAAPDTATLAGVITARIAADPTAVGDQDAQIHAAVTTATSSLLASRPPSSSGRDAGNGSPDASAPDAGISLDASAPDADTAMPAFQLLRGPSARALAASTGGALPESVSVKNANPYGLSVQPSLDDLGVYMENTTRTHREYFVYRNGYVPSSGKSTDPPTTLTTWQQTTSGNLTAVTGVTDIVTSLINFFSGNLPWVPQDTPTLPLPLNPADAKANGFKVYAVGPGATVNQAVLSDIAANQPSLMNALASAQSDASLLTWFKEIIWPLLTKVIPPSALPISDSAFLPLVRQIATEATSFGLNLSAHWEKGEIGPAASDFVALITGDSQFRAAVFNTTFNFLISQSSDPYIGKNFVATWASIFSDVVAYVKLADTLLAITDTGSVLYQVSQSDQYDAWDVTATVPPVTISPTAATVAANATQMFQASVGAGLGNLGALVYDFSATYGSVAGIGTAGDVISNNGHELFSNAATVIYTSPADVNAMEADTITVSVTFDPTTAPAGTSVAVGSATATIAFVATFGDTCADLQACCSSLAGGIQNECTTQWYYASITPGGASVTNPICDMWTQYFCGSG